ncbi:hypothetical protein ISS05_03475 [Candidatus Woesearchaeota archaeon]|nr:hypothetical protein [Candidatus Woesearchaeota archaeon]
MSKLKNLDEVYNQCVAEGNLQEPEEIDIEKVKSLLDNAELDLKSIKDITTILEKNKNFGKIWSDRYEIIRQLVQGILLLEKVSSNNHQCLYARSCVKHPEWEIDWETIETMRLLRNGVHYEGRPVNAETWKQYKLKFEIYTNTFNKILKEKLKEITSC